jgi:hypothetical protein
VVSLGDEHCERWSGTVNYIHCDGPFGCMMMCKNAVLQPLECNNFFDYINTTQHLIFPGGGVYFWWQAGVIQALRERFDLKNGNFSMHGASAGSVSCVMAACDVNMHDAMQANFNLPAKSDVFTHGRLVELWLQRILPHDCHILCSGKVNISVTKITASCMPLHRKVVNTFSSKQDLIDACLTSSHIPWFLDGQFSRSFRGDRCVDGSVLFLLHNKPWTGPELNQGALVIYHGDDTALMEHNWGVLHTLDKKSLVGMFNMGHAYATREWVQNIPGGASHVSVV